jgi:serine/threonine-protein kinase HipA
MPRKRQHTPLRVLLNNRLVGYLEKEPGGGIHFRYDRDWIEWEYALPVSLSLPLREDVFKGAPVIAVFDNLLPDSNQLRRRVAERVGAEGTDAYNLLARIGRDCVGALQFVPDDQDLDDGGSNLSGETLNESQIESILKNLARAPLGLDRDEEFRISVAGAQEKTALLFHQGKWLKPHGTTPTTHILKPPIGTLPNGIDLSHSVENEYYCLELLAAFGLPVNRAEIQTFGKTKALVIERFDRKWTDDGRLLRLPQEDCCQALSIPPSRRYQSEGGPGMVDVLNLLKGADRPLEDQRNFMKAQILYWLMGATDGHAKNVSVFLGRGGRFRMTPLYDVLTAQPSLDSRQIVRKQMKLAMAAGRNHYRIDYIQGRHFTQTVERAGLPPSLAVDALADIANRAKDAFEEVERQLPSELVAEIHESVRAGFLSRIGRI